MAAALSPLVEQKIDEHANSLINNNSLLRQDVMAVVRPVMVVRIGSLVRILVKLFKAGLVAKEDKIAKRLGEHEDPSQDVVEETIYHYVIEKRPIESHCYTIVRELLCIDEDVFDAKQWTIFEHEIENAVVTFLFELYFRNLL